ncbi:MAG: polyprenyl synthetase family protein [Cytophagales bacterium]|nr:polyprenyl synthetase family protein [Bernardetiaceae bacterium]MDW8203701.1 polyprenyl synthetase family protein [Cytophagales bacterium]
MAFDFLSAQAAIEKAILQLELGEKPVELYEPIHYIMSLGGKRMRPMLVLLGKYAVSGSWQETVPAAIVVEMFHNFTLLHDDVMDKAPLRRGKPTVHVKWNENIALLSGDAMLVKTYEHLMNHVPATILPALLRRFCQTAIQVCEGQQMDMNFEQLKRVSMEEYLAMIRLKTAVLLGFSLEMGALLGGASSHTIDKLYEFGIQLGIGFQLKDDMLDVYGEPDKFGKQVGGDIIANKKTYLLIRALEKANAMQTRELDYWLSVESFDPQTKIDAVKEIYDQLHVQQDAENIMNQYFERGFTTLAEAGLAPERYETLYCFARSIIEREK